MMMMMMIMILHVPGFVKKKKKKALNKRYGDTYLEWNIAKHLVSKSYFLHRDSTTALHLSWNRLQKPF